MSLPRPKDDSYYIPSCDLRLRFSLDIQVVCQKSKKNRHSNKKSSFTPDWLQKVCPKKSSSIFEQLEHQIINELDLMKEKNDIESVQKLLGKPVLELALDQEDMFF